MKTKYVNKAAALIITLCLALAAVVTLTAAPKAYAAGEVTVNTAQVSTTYEAGQTTGRKLKFTETQDGNKEASIRIKTVAAAPGKLIIFGFYNKEGVTSSASGASTDKGVSILGYATGELELYNNAGWKQLSVAGGSEQLFGDGKTLTFTLSREISGEDVSYKIYYTPDGGEKTLWKDLSSGLAHNGYTYSFTDEDVLIDNDYTWFGLNIFTDARNATLWDYKTTVEGVEFVNAEGAKITDVLDAEGNSYNVISSKITANGYEFVTHEEFTPAKVKFINSYGKTVEVNVTDNVVRFAVDSVSVGTQDIAVPATKDKQWNAYDNGGMIYVSDEEGFTVNLKVSGSGGNFGIFFAPSNGVGWPAGLSKPGMFNVFFTNAGGRLCPEMYMHYNGNNWLQLSKTVDPNDNADMPLIRTNGSDVMKFSLKKVNGEWGVYINDALIPFVGHGNLKDTEFEQYTDKKFNPLNVAFASAEWRNADGFTNFGIVGWEGDNSVTMTVPKVAAVADVTDLTGVTDAGVSYSTFDESGKSLSAISVAHTETGLSYTSFNADKIAKITFTTSGGVTTEFNVDYANKTADSVITVGSDAQEYKKTIAVNKGGEPLLGAEITIFDGDKNITDNVKITDNGDGTYTLSGVNKPLTVRADSGSFNGSVNVTKEESEFIVSLYEEYAATLVLNDYTGVALDGMADFIFVYEDGIAKTANVTFADGKYIVGGLYSTNGDWKIRFEKDGYVSAESAVTLAGKDVTLTVIRVYSVAVTLNDENGNAVLNAENNIKAFNGNEEENVTVTFSDGKYILSGIRQLAAEQLVKFEMEGYEVRSSAVTVASAQEGITLTTKATAQSVTVKVRVLDKDGNEIKNAMLVLTDSDDEFTYDEQNGVWTLRGVYGDVTVMVTASGYKSSTVTITAAQPEITVTLEKTGGTTPIDPDEEKPDKPNNKDDGGCGGEIATASAMAGAVLILACAAGLIKRKQENK